MKKNLLIKYKRITKSHLLVNSLMGILFCSILFFSCTEWNEHYDLNESDQMSIYQVLKMNPDYQYFVKALDKSGYDKVLNGQEVFTVFIPEKEALSNTELDDDAFRRLIGNHIIIGKHYVREITDTLKARSLSQKYYYLFPDKELGFRLSNRKHEVQPIIGKSDIQSRNGVAHSINGIIETVPNIKEIIDNLDAEKYSIFLSEYNRLDSINTEMEELRLGLNEKGEVVRDTLPYWVYPAFNPAQESRDITLLVPTDEAIITQKNNLIAMNGGDAEKISDYYFVRLIRNQLLQGAYPKDILLDSDTILTDGGQKVIGRKIKKLDAQKVASNGYVFETTHVLYQPAAVDFIDSLTYEAEWALGVDGHEKTIIYTTENIPLALGDDIELNKHLYCYGLNRGHRINLFVPNVFAGLYQVKLVYKQSDILIRLLSEGRIVNEQINLETLVPVDPNNEDPNVFPNVEVGFVFHQEHGYLNIEFEVLRGTFASMMIDKIVLVPVEY